MGTEVATKWVYEFSEGSRDMRDLLGGKGANVAEMTRVLGPERVPAGFTITTEACVAYMRDGGFPDGLEDQVSSALSRARGAGGQEARRRRRPAARLGAQRRARVDAGHARHRPQPRPQRRVRRRPGQADRQRALRVGLLPALRADVRERRQGRRRARRSRTRSRRSRRTAASRTTRTSTPTRCGRSSTRFKGLYRDETGEDFPQEPQAPARGRDPRGVRLLERRARGQLPPHQPHPRRLGDGGQRPADGLRQQGRHERQRRRVQPRRGHRRARAVAATSSSTPRARTSSPACATRSTSPS